jgi:hypothetical protein
MADRRPLFFILLPLFLLPRFLSGQEPPPETGGSFYIERTGEEERFIQRFVWEKTEHAYRYEITIEEQNSAGEYTEIYKESRTSNFIELSLPPNLYRYQITVYNLLDRPAGISGWIPFRVFPALQPELYSFSQEFAPGGEGDLRDTEIILYGKNLTEGAEVYLRPMDTGENPIVPSAYLSSGERARLVFNREPPAPGRYRVYVKNPGGLETSLEITVHPPAALSADVPSVDTVPDGDSGYGGIYVSAEYAPLIPISGYLFDPFDQTFYPAGASLRLDIVPIARSWGDLGLELAPSWAMLRSGSTKIHIGTFHLNGLYYRWLPKRTMAFIFRLGAGTGFVYGTNGDQNSDSIFTWMFSADGGIFFRWFAPIVYNFRWIARRTLYFEIGAEYTYLFAKDSPAGYVKPVLGIGWRF